MAVNGVEIIEGSEWFTKDGRSGRITRNDNNKTYCWWLISDNGYASSYTAYGKYIAGHHRERDLSHPVRHTSPKTALTLSEIAARKEALQRKLETFVHNEISNFQEENCVSISNVNLNFTKVYKSIPSQHLLILTGVD
mgnify:CR=1 FL=1